MIYYLELFVIGFMFITVTMAVTILFCQNGTVHPELFAIGFMFIAAATAVAILPKSS